METAHDQSQGLKLWQNWRQERAYRIGQILSVGGFILAILAALLNANYTTWLVVLGDVLLVFGCMASFFLSWRSKQRFFVWQPIYFSYLLAMNLTVWPTGGLYSPFLGVFVSLLFVGGIVIQNRFSMYWVLGLCLANLVAWGAIEFVYPRAAFSYQPLLFVMLLFPIGLAAIAVGILGFLQTERNLSREISRHYDELYDTKLSLFREESANAAKSSFLANISHELRTPLGAILGFADLLRDRNVPPEEKIEYAETIWRNGDQLARLVDDLLDLSKVEAGKIEIERIDFKPAKLLSEVMDLLRIKAEEKKLDFRVRYTNAVPETLRGDPVRIKQVLVNIIGNAIKFTHQGHVQVEAQYFPAFENESEKLCFHVKDSGRGMTREQSQRLFQPFTQADPSMTRKYGGTGLGLSLSRQLARLMGGDLKLTSSELGRGSVFTASMTVERVLGSRLVHEFKYRLESPLAAVGASESGTLRGYKILAVDDTDDNRQLLKRYLDFAGATTEFANDGLEGIQKALAGEFDIVLMDIQMPGMDGFQATTLLRQRNFYKPILALTAHAMKSDRDRCLAAGCDDYLSKPFKRADLIERIKSLADDTGPSRPDKTLPFPKQNQL